MSRRNDNEMTLPPALMQLPTTENAAADVTTSVEMRLDDDSSSSLAAASNEEDSSAMLDIGSDERTYYTIHVMCIHRYMCICNT